MPEFINAWRQYAVFEGRTRRRDFWLFVLLSLIACAMLDVLDRVQGGGVEGGGVGRCGEAVGQLVSLYGLAALVPSLAVAARRLHDTGRSGWYALLLVVPFGVLFLLAWWAEDSVVGENRWGVNPKSDSMSAQA